MFCSSCGTALTPGLSYCKRCGNKLGEKEGDRPAKTSHSFAELLVCLMVAVFVLGIGAIISMMALMKNLLNLGNDWILGFSAGLFLLTLALEGVLVWQLRRQKGVAKETGEAALPQGQTARELDAATQRALPEPSSSVTEHTTRTFDPIYVERESGQDLAADKRSRT